MSNMRITTMEEFVQGKEVAAGVALKQHLRNSAVIDFLRYLETPTFFKYQDEEEIKEIKNTWAGYAFVIMNDRLNGKELTELEKTFLDEYFEKYLLKGTPVGLENVLKYSYLKYRLSSDFTKNDVLNDFQWTKHPEYEEGVEEFRVTIEALIKQMYGENITISIDTNRDSTDFGIYIASTKEVRVSNWHIDSAYLDYLRNGYDIKYVMDFIFKISDKIELSGLNQIKRKDISEKAVIYTVEDYLYNKAGKKNKLGLAYKELYSNIIANKQITIDSSKLVMQKMMELSNNLLLSEYNNMNTQIESSMNNIIDAVENMKHYYNDANYFDTNNLEEDAFTQIYLMYLRGLKAMPKSHITNVTKYFAINGNPLTIYDMKMMEFAMNLKIARAKSEEKKQELAKQAEEITNVINFVTKYGYTLENKIYDLVNNKENEPNEEIIDLVYNNIDEAIALLYKLETSYNSSELIASSGSPTKMGALVKKVKFINAMKDILTSAFNAINENKDEKYIPFENIIDLDKDVLLVKYKNNERMLALIQELMGRGVLSGSKLLSQDGKKTPIMHNLKPGFKKFYENALELKGGVVARRKQ